MEIVLLNVFRQGMLGRERRRLVSHGARTL